MKPASPSLLTRPVDHAAPHWGEYAAELAGTAFNLFVGLSAAVLGFGDGGHLLLGRLVPDPGLRLWVVGLIFAGSGSLVAISPLGRLSGAHINPAVTLAFWLRGKMHRHDLGGYLLGQFLGGCLGAWLLVTAWGAWAGSVNDGMTLPGPDYPLWYVFLSEFGMTFVLLLAIFTFLSSQRLMRWTPLMTWLLVAFLVRVGAPVSGTSLNPARSFGPALVRWTWRDQWLYLVAPPLGAVAAVLAFGWLAAGRKVLTAKLFHLPHDRSIFKNLHVPTLHHPQPRP